VYNARNKNLKWQNPSQDHGNACKYENPLGAVWKDLTLGEEMT